MTRPMTRCVDCGDVLVKNRKPYSPYWCPKCESERRERITKGFADIRDHLEAKSGGKCLVCGEATEGDAMCWACASDAKEYAAERDAEERARWQEDYEANYDAQEQRCPGCARRLSDCHCASHL